MCVSFMILLFPFFSFFSCCQKGKIIKLSIKLVNEQTGASDHLCLTGQEVKPRQQPKTVVDGHLASSWPSNQAEEAAAKAGVDGHRFVSQEAEE